MPFIPEPDLNVAGRRGCAYWNPKTEVGIYHAVQAEIQAPSPEFVWAMRCEKTQFVVFATGRDEWLRFQNDIVEKHLLWCKPCRGRYNYYYFKEEPKSGCLDYPTFVARYGAFVPKPILEQMLDLWPSQELILEGKGLTIVRWS